jgi:hypothetical protein
MIDINEISKNLLLIQYPSGGYGYYLCRLINSFVSNVVSTKDPWTFDTVGTSHSLPLVVGDIHHEHSRHLHALEEKYLENIQNQKYIIIPYCPGIENDSTKNLELKYPTAKKIRLWYDDRTWPLVFQNCIIKALQGSLEENVKFDSALFNSSDNWARRENYTLLNETHSFRQMWKPYNNNNFLNVNIFDLINDPKQVIINIANLIQTTADLTELLAYHQKFLNANPNTVEHFQILEIINNIKQEYDLSSITSLYQQAVFNFYIKQKFNFEIPVYDYSNWFANTLEVVKMLKKHGVHIDSN